MLCSFHSDRKLIDITEVCSNISICEIWCHEQSVIFLNSISKPPVYCVVCCPKHLIMFSLFIVSIYASVHNGILTYQPSSTGGLSHLQPQLMTLITNCGTNSGKSPSCILTRHDIIQIYHCEFVWYNSSLIKPTHDITNQHLQTPALIHMSGGWINHNSSSRSPQMNCWCISVTTVCSEVSSSEHMTQKDH